LVYEIKRNLILMKKQMEGNLAKDIYRMKHSGKSTTTFIAILV
jgi:hypothetical protein